jgi:predicted ester cyclase
MLDADRSKRQLRSKTQDEEDAMSETEERNKQIIVRLYEEVVNQGRLELLDEMTWPDHVEHNPFPQQSQGREGLKQRVSMVRAAFNPRFTIEHLVAEDDKVAVMWTNAATHVGAWFGFPPTEQSMTFHGVDIHLLRDGRLAAHWDVVDITDFLAKLGVLPAPAAAGAAR